MLDAETVVAGANLIAGVHPGIARRQRVEEGTVSAAEVADADDSLGIGDDFEVTPRQELIRHAHVSFATDDETARRNLELLSVQRTINADEHRALRWHGG